MLGVFDVLGSYVVVCRGQRHKMHQNGPAGELIAFLDVLPLPDYASHSHCPHALVLVGVRLDCANFVLVGVSS